MPKLDKLTVKAIATGAGLVAEIQLLPFGGQLLRKPADPIRSIGLLAPVSHFSSALAISNSHGYCRFVDIQPNKHAILHWSLLHS